MYQPKLCDALIRKLYYAAKAHGLPMTHYLSEIVEEALVGEPEPPLYEPYPRKKKTRRER